MHKGLPDGPWRLTRLLNSKLERTALEYRNGELIGVYGPDGQCDLQMLNSMRAERGLPVLIQRGLREGRVTEEQAHD